MKKEVKKQNTGISYPFYLLIAFVIVTPLIFSTAVESMFDAVKSSAFRILGGLFIITTAYYIWNKLKHSKTDIIVNKALDISVLLILFGAVVSTIFSINPYVSMFGQYARQIGLITYVMLALIYLFASFILNSAEKRDKLLFAMEMAATLVAVYSILQYLGMDPFNIQRLAYVRPISALGTSVFAAGLMTIVIPFAAIRAYQNKFSIVYILSPVIILTGIVISQTRAAYTALFVELLLFVLLYIYILKHDNKRFNKARKTGFIILGSIIIAVVALNIFFPHSVYVKRFQSIITIAETQRWALWKTSLNMFWKYPITGTGISMFSRGLEDFMTIALKSKEGGGYYDNAHNNFLHTLAVMGIIGLGAYLVMLFSSIRLSIISLFSSAEKKNRSNIFIAFICMFGGYIVYGLADFDEIAILSYLFIFLAILKSELFSAGSGTILKLDKKVKLKFKNAIAITAVIVVIFGVYNIYSAYIDFKADKIYSEGLRSYQKGNISELNSKIKQAMELNPRAEYRYTYAYYNYLYCFDNPVLNPTEIKQILREAEEQAKITMKNSPSELECLGLISLIKYELGDTAEAEKIKNEVLAKDTLLTDFRVNLSRYYFKNRKEDLALEQLRVVYTYDPKNVDAYFTSVVYLMKKKEYNYAENCCNTILKIMPGNPDAIRYLNEIRRLKEVNKKF